jgi:hypothetical protein
MKKVRGAVTPIKKPTYSLTLSNEHFFSKNGSRMPVLAKPEMLKATPIATNQVRKSSAERV